jgi:hypothetical protein
MGTQETLNGTVPCNEVLCVELGGEGRCLDDQIKCVHAEALLALLKDMPEQGMFEMLELTDWSGVICHPLALQHRQDGVVISGSLLLPLDKKGMSHLELFGRPAQRHPLLLYNTISRCKETKLTARIVAYAHPLRQSAWLDEPRHGGMMLVWW